MKKIYLPIIFTMLLLLVTACSGSDAIQGSWETQDSNGNYGTMVFEDKTITYDGKTFEYTQNAVGTKNGIQYYGIRQNGQTYSIIFPEKDKNIAFMIVPDSSDSYLTGSVVYVMDRTQQPNYSEYVEAYLK